MTVPTEITTHVADAGALTLGQFFSKPRIQALLGFFTAEVQRAEPVIHDLITEQILDNAVGAQLDRWGRILGLPRTDASDADYLARLRTQLIVLHSRGGTAELQEIVSRMSGDVPVRYWQAGNAHYVLETEVAVPTSAARRAAIEALLFRASPSGVAFTAVEGETDASFRFGTAGRGFGAGKLAGLVAQVTH